MSKIKYLRAQLLRQLIAYFGDDDRRIEHAMRVLFHSERLLPEYPDCDREIALAAAVLHDVGIKKAEELHGYNDGRLQECYGPEIAGQILDAIGFSPDKAVVVQNIISNHHSPSRYPYPELALLKAADKIVNRDEHI